MTHGTRTLKLLSDIGSRQKLGLHGFHSGASFSPTLLAT
jgi:hypothetical protein